ncbi:MAG: hypothetical protein ACYTHM_00805 [Planctomycetota bacterium]|jgi:hypothetical protein
MGKTLLAVFAGVFVGALAVEILNRKKPGWSDRMVGKVKNTLGAAKQAFKEGYQAQKA